MLRSTTQPRPTTLARQIGAPGAVMLGLGSILGSGVFVGVGLAADLAGPSLPAAIALAALLATCNALSSAQLAAAHPVSGGAYEYGRSLLTPAFGFVAGWMFLCAKTASAATAAIGAASYGLALADITSDAARSVAAGLAAAAATALVLSGLRRSSTVNIAVVSFTIAALLALGLAALAASPRGAAERLTPVLPGPEGWRDFFAATALMFVAFTGYGRIATLGEEVKEPRRTIPLAVVATLAASTALYLIAAAAGIVAIGADGLATATTDAATPLGAAASALGGSGLGLVLAVGALAAMLGVLLNLLLGLSRVVLAMSRRRDFPPAFARLSGRGEPAAAVALVGAAVSLLAVVGTVESTWTFSALMVLVYYAVANLAALRLPRAQRLYPSWIPGVGLAGCLGLAFFIPAPVWFAGLLLTMTGFLLRAAFMRSMTA